MTGSSDLSGVALREFPLVEIREYRIRPKVRGLFWDNYREIGLPVQMRYLKNPLGFFFVDVGSPNVFVHMWGYESTSDREKARALLHDDNHWNDYVKMAHEYIDEINIRLLQTLK